MQHDWNPESLCAHIDHHVLLMHHCLHPGSLCVVMTTSKAHPAYVFHICLMQTAEGFAIIESGVSRASTGVWTSAKGSHTGSNKPLMGGQDAAAE